MRTKDQSGSLDGKRTFFAKRRSGNRVILLFPLDRVKHEGNRKRAILLSSIPFVGTWFLIMCGVFQGANAERKKAPSGTFLSQPPQQTPQRKNDFTWWSIAGSNRRPRPCEGRALPAELMPHGSVNIYELRPRFKNQNSPFSFCAWSPSSRRRFRVRKFRRVIIR